MKFETDKPNEYFLVENRTRTGLDAHLPSSGLAVYHCDTRGSNELQEGTASRHYQCALLQADGRRDLENNRESDADDLFTETADVALASTTTPSSKEWDGSDSGLKISNISAPGNEITFRLGEPEIVPGVTHNTSGSVAPDLLIPDDDERGVKSVIDIQENGALEAVRVSVDITHTWSGDLQLNLIGPNGQNVLLRDNHGRHTIDINETYDSANHAALPNIVGEQIHGPWTLHAQDLERRDVGRINEWSIEIDYRSEGQTVEAEASPNLAIPDDNPQVASSAIPISANGALKYVTVSVRISHTFIRDLQVELVSPAGVSAKLHDRAGGSAHDIIQTYDRTNATDLASLVGQAIHGDWALRIRDLEAADEGTLEEWSLRLVY